MMAKIHKRACRVVLIMLFAVCSFCQESPNSVEQARALLDSGKIQEAESALRTVVGAQPENADAHFLLGYALFREQKARNSLAEFTAGAKYRRPRADEQKVVAADYV